MNITVKSIVNFKPYAKNMETYVGINNLITRRLEWTFDVSNRIPEHTDYERISFFYYDFEEC